MPITVHRCQYHYILASHMTDLLLHDWPKYFGEEYHTIVEDQAWNVRYKCISIGLFIFSKVTLHKQLYSIPANHWGNDKLRTHERRHEFNAAEEYLKQKLVFGHLGWHVQEPPSERLY